MVGCRSTAILIALPQGGSSWYDCCSESDGSADLHYAAHLGARPLTAKALKTAAAVLAVRATIDVDIAV